MKTNMVSPGVGPVASGLPTADAVSGAGSALVRSRLARVALAAWVNVDPDKIPAEKMWIEHANDVNRQAWDRVIDALFVAFEADHGWRTIDSAPVGIIVDVWGFTTLSGTSYEHRAKIHWRPVGERRTDVVLCPVHKCWRIAADTHFVNRLARFTPTHWQPLPAAPMLPRDAHPRDAEKPQQNQTPNGGGGEP